MSPFGEPRHLHFQLHSGIFKAKILQNCVRNEDFLANRYQIKDILALSAVGVIAKI